MMHLRHASFVLVFSLFCAVLTGCDGSDKRRARYAEKRPDPQPLERSFAPPKKELPPPPEKKQPVWIDYKGEDMRQLTELSGRRVLIVFYAPWSQPSTKFVDAVKEYAESQNGKAYAVLIDADSYPDLARKYKVEAVPLTVLYLEGMKLREMVGGVSSCRLKELIENIVSVD